MAAKKAAKKQAKSYTKAPGKMVFKRGLGWVKE